VHSSHSALMQKWMLSEHDILTTQFQVLTGDN